MRLPFPTKISLWGAIIFACILCFFEIIQGTPAYFVATVFLYVILSTLAFNIAGGLARPSGAYIFFQVILTLLAGLVLKAILWEPADSNLRVPETTILVNLGITCSLLIAAIVKRYVIKKEAILDGLLTASNTTQITIGCVLAGVSVDFIDNVMGHEDGSVLSALHRVNVFVQLGMLIGTYGVIRASGGRRSLSLIAFLGSAYTFIVGGIVGYSKEAMLGGLVAWLIVVAATGYRLSLKQVALALTALFLIGYYLVPYAQGGRATRGQEHPYDVAIANLGRIEEFREQLKLDAENELSDENAPLYFSTPLGTYERITMVGWDDALIASAVNGSYVGYIPIFSYIYNVVPHFLWPSKPSPLWGNAYGRRIGVLPDDDVTTGISFSPAGEAYVLDGWNSVIFVVPFIYIFAFSVIDSTCGDVRKSPWGLFFVLQSVHSANEGFLGTPFMFSMFYAPLIIIAGYFTVYVLPLVGSLFLPPSRSSATRFTPPQKIAGQRQL